MADINSGQDVDIISSVAIPVTDNGATLSIDDGAGSITVDGSVTATAQPGVDIGDVTINNASGASAVNIQDGGNTITVDGTVQAQYDPGTIDVFGRPTTTSPNNDIDIQFFRAAPGSLLTVTTANSATATSNVGGALFASSTNTNGSVQGVTTETTTYKSGSEVYAMFTASFTAGIASSYMRIGLYDANNGFFIGYEGTTFGVTVRNNAVDTQVAKASFSEDDLTGSATSLFTRDGTPEAIDLTKLNVFRIRFGWLGSAPCFWEVMSPDGHWVTFHKTLFPNLQTTPSVRSADLPITLDITKTGAAATDLQIQTDCWGAGTSAGTQEAQSDKIAFSTTTVLAGGATYSSGLLALSPKYSQVQTQVLASKAGTINIYWYSDAAGTDLVRTITLPYGASDGFQMFAAPAFTPYVKYEYVNDSGAAQTDFYFETKFLRRPLSPQILRVDGTIVGGMVSTLNRSVIAGETSAGGGSYVNLKVNPSGTLSADVTGTVTANAGTDLNTSALALETTATSIKNAVETIDNAIAGTEMQVDVVGALPAGDNNIGNVDIASSVTLVVDATGQGDVPITLAGEEVTVNLGATDNAVLDSIESNTAPIADGASTVFDADGDNTAQQIKASAGKLYGLEVSNPNTVDAYIQLFDLATGSVTVGTTTPKQSYLVPGGDGINNGAMDKVFTIPVSFATAITYACTTTATGSGDPTTGLVVNAIYI